LNSILVKCARQPPETNLCGYYVCDFIHTLTTENKDYDADVSNTFTTLFYYCHIFIMIDGHNLSPFLIQFERTRDKVLPDQRIQRVAEELAGFLLKEVINDDGKFSVNRPYY
jgi:hypothetical protein